MDTRSLLSLPTGRLTQPSWPLARPGREFLRSTGAIRKRLRGGVDGWPGEDHFCDLSSAIRFPNRLGSDHLGSATRTRCAFRRLYSDGIVLRAVIGLQTATASSPSLRRTDVHQFQTIVNSVLTLPVRIASSTSPARRLQDAGPTLADHILRVSTCRAGSDPVRVQPKLHWIESGTPQVLIEYAETEYSEFPRYCRIVHEVGGFDWKIAFMWANVRDRPIGVWLLRRRPDTSRADEIRRLRIHLFRLHSEWEALGIVLRQIASGKFALSKRARASDELQRYLADSVRLLKKGTRYGFPQSPILDAASRCTNLVDQGKLQNLSSQLSNTRRSVNRMVLDFARTESARARASIVVNNIHSGATHVSATISFGDNVQVNGDFNLVVAERIENSFNKVASSAASDDLKHRLKDLGIQVAELIKALPEDAGEEVSRDYQTLADEATSKAPRRKWYELSAAGLIDAAKAVATMATPVANAVKAVLKLLGD